MPLVAILGKSVLSVMLVLVSTARPALGQVCQWAPLGSQPDGPVESLKLFDDGSAPALFVGGGFRLPSYDIAKWNGSQWSDLDGGIDWFGVEALMDFNDGTGPALYAGGTFVPWNHIAKWDGTRWSSVGGGVSDAVAALTVFDDGTGLALYAGGYFTTAGGVTVNGIAKWDGTQWSPLGTGMDNGVLALEVFDDGTGSALYAGGLFHTAGGVIVNGIAKWDGTRWSALNTGVNDFVRALRAFDSGTGPSLYAGGVFTIADGVVVNGIARWNGTQWSTVGTGIGVNGDIAALTVFDNGTGSALYAGGFFTSVDGVTANHVAKWDGAQWSPLGNGTVFLHHVLALEGFNDGTGPALYVGGSSNILGGDQIGKWSCN